MKGMFTTYVKVGAGTGALLLGLFVAFRPHVTTIQRGYSGTGMELNVNDRTADSLVGASQYPEPYGTYSPDGPRAGMIYQNVKVLGHTSITEFGYIMNNIAEWVVSDQWLAEEEARYAAEAREKGIAEDEVATYVGERAQKCNYCHVYGNMASDAKYTKHVSRRMIQMTQHVNSQWKSHVGNVGVTCYTCHRGMSVPQYIWFEKPEGPNEFEFGFGTQAGQNQPGYNVGLASLPSDPFDTYLVGPDSLHEGGRENEYGIRMLGEAALPGGEKIILPGNTPSPGGAVLKGERVPVNRRSIKQTEWTYGLMMHYSNALGVNCTYCHNTRAMAAWTQSPPTRTTAWHGTGMVRTLNRVYLIGRDVPGELDMKKAYLGGYGETVPPVSRLGPNGDPPKLNCMTCHQGAYKPLLGAYMLEDYPALAAPAPDPQVSMTLD